MNKKISVIVPVYNSESHIRKTIELLCNQTYKNLEIIFIDNGSIDNSKKICKEYAKKDNRIIVSEERKRGPSAARNKGISLATGEYICFCDSDDLPQIDMYETLLEYILSQNTDIVMCEIYSERIDGLLDLPYDDKAKLSKKEIVNDLIPKMIGNLTEDEITIPIWGSVVRCIYKKSIIEENSIKFPEDISFAEDLIFTLTYLKKSDYVGICKKVLYKYRMTEGSVMLSCSKYEEDKFNKRKRLYLYLQEILMDIGNYETVKERLLVTYRSYIAECIGNAFRNKEKKSGLVYEYIEEKRIMNDESVIEAFKFFNTQDIRKKVLYIAIRNKLAIFLAIYFKMRFSIEKIKKVGNRSER